MQYIIRPCPPHWGRRKPFPTLLLSVNVLPLSSWFKGFNHILIAWRGGLGPTNFVINSWSLNIAMQANNFFQVHFKWDDIFSY